MTANNKQNTSPVLLSHRDHQKKPFDVRSEYNLENPESQSKSRICWANLASIKPNYTKVVFEVLPNLFLPNATIRHHLENYLPSKPDVIGKLLASDQQETFTMYKTSNTILKKEGFPYCFR